MNIFLLDMDDTLLDFGRAEKENFFRTLSAYGIPADDALAARFHTVNDGLWKALERGETTREKLKTQRFELLFAEYRIDADAEAIAQSYYVGFPYILFPYAGALDFLKALKERGRVYLVTNGGSLIQREHIRRAGFGPYLDGAFISEELGANKPSAEFAARVAAGIPRFCKEQAVWLGDSLTSDAPCAARLGVRFVLYSPSGRGEYRGEVATGYEEAFALMTAP